MTQDVETSSGSELGLPSPKERRWLRESGGLTYEEVAARAGVTAATVRSWECGRTEPRGRTREAYAALLDRLAATGAAPVRPVAAGLPTRRPRNVGKHATQPPARPPQTARETQATREAQAAQAAPAGQGAGEAQAAQTGQGAQPTQVTQAAAQAPGEARTTHTAQTAQATHTPQETHPAQQAHPARPVPTEPALPAAPAPAPTATEAAPASAGPTAPAAVAPAPGEPFHQGGPAHTGAEPGTPQGLPATPAAATRAARPYGPRPKPPEDPVEAFDALYDHAAAALVRQAYLLTGRRALALHSVEVAFRQAWGRWPEVATDPDPVGWVRSAAYEYALSPWHRFRRAHRHPDRLPADPADRILLDALLALPPVHRRTVLLYDGVGLDLPDTAAETEASTPAAGHRLLRAHAELVRRIPGLAGLTPEQRSALLRERLGAVRPAVSLEPRPAATVRTVSEHRARRLARAALVLTAVIAASTGYTTVTAPDHYEPPIAPGASVSGVPPLSGPPRLTETGRSLQDKLRADPAAGPHRLAPQPE
ncbi:helix-turn-helix domain-containing protein [Streptomyces sp. NPDC012794]|uniref:helix-turn-helix domain-containing protein n=1 Tax=Streptomyces sp. NPDC012794 TaxID=3364850 RepID=UPI0036A59E1F